MNNALETIKTQLTHHKIVLYMKGTPVFPQCGFSARAVQILKNALQGKPVQPDDVCYVNVLEDNDIREAIKQYGQWPTIPQLYIQGELVGGSDIVAEMQQSGELGQLLDAAFQER